MKYLLTCNPKTKIPPQIVANINIIRDKYPCAGSAAHIFHEFYDIIMGQDPQALDIFIAKYRDSAIHSFCNRLKKISPLSRMRYLCQSVMDLLKVITTNSNSSNVLYMVGHL